MSRIVRGHSEDVKGVRITQGPLGKASPKALSQPAFRMIQSEGTLTRAEADAEIQVAVQKARMEAAHEAEQKLRAPILGTLENLDRVLDELSRFRRELFKECEAEVLEIIRVLAKKVFQTELTLNPEHLHQLIEKSLEVVHKEKQIELRLNAKNLNEIKASRPDIFEKYKDQIDIQVDSEMPVSSAKVLTKTRQIDIDVNSIVDDILNHVLNEKQEVKETGDDEDKV